MAEEINRDTRYEPAQLARHLPLMLIGGLGLLLLITLGGLALLYPSALHPRAEGPPEPPPPEPRLATDEMAELRQLRAEETQRLAGYGWVDRAQGLVHIPIEEAMRRIASQGIPTWPAR
jgi:hypothetical protein